MTKTARLAVLLLATPVAPALAQPTAAPAQTPVGPPAEKVTQVFVYGDDPCPASSGEEILVCARLPDGDRYRIPRDLRTDPNSPAVQSWANRAKSIEYVGRSGTDSCTPVGGGGFTGCFQQLARRAREERQAYLGEASWADAVAREREKRLGNLDAESREIEARVQQEEKAAANAGASTTSTGTSTTTAPQPDADVDPTPLPEPKSRKKP